MSNYVEMWKDLGMDLDTHDQLCQVLPTAFGDVYLSQENRPEAMGFWDFVVSEIHGIRPSELIEAQKKGQKDIERPLEGAVSLFVPLGHLKVRYPGKDFDKAIDAKAAH